jgi:uncharacterized protein YodC (DUF2158 family)
MIEVYPVGTVVLLEEDVEAKVITVSLHDGDYVQYECAWWSGQSRSREWFSEGDILKIVDVKKKRKIGFHSHV